jgi:hypothetical protein
MMKKQRVVTEGDYDLLIWLTAENSYWNNVSLWLTASNNWWNTEGESVFRSGGQLKQYGPRPRIAVARPRPSR